MRGKLNIVFLELSILEFFFLYSLFCMLVKGAFLSVTLGLFPFCDPDTFFL